MQRLWFILIVVFFLTGVIDSHARDYDPTTLVFPPYLHSYGIRKATKYHLFLFMQNRVKFRDPQALAVVRLDSWDDPESSDDDDEVTVYGVNSGQHNIIFNTSMTSLGVYGLNEKGVHKLNRPMGIAANSVGDVFVADTGNDRIVRLYNSGHKLRYIKQIGVRGTKPGEFIQPHDVGLDSKGIIYVTDSGNHRVQIFNKNDSLIHSFGEFGTAPGNLNFPVAIAVNDHDNSWTYFRDDFLVVIDLNHQRIQKYNLTGKFLKGITSSEIGCENAFFSYLAIDYYSNIYVTDKHNHCIHKFDRKLNYLTSYGREGTGDKEFIQPRGITIYRRFGQIFIAEKNGAQYYWVGTDVLSCKIVKHSERNNFFFLRYFITEPSFLTIDLYDNHNNFVSRLRNKRFHFSGKQQDIWSGNTSSWTDSIFAKEDINLNSAYRNLKTVPPGDYELRFKFEPTYSSYHYFEKVITRQLTIE